MCISSWAASIKFILVPLISCYLPFPIWRLTEASCHCFWHLSSARLFSIVLSQFSSVHKLGIKSVCGSLWRMTTDPRLVRKLTVSITCINGQLSLHQPIIQVEAPSSQLARCFASTSPDESFEGAKRGMSNSSPLHVNGTSLIAAGETLKPWVSDRFFLTCHLLSPTHSLFHLLHEPRVLPSPVLPQGSETDRQQA